VAIGSYRELIDAMLGGAEVNATFRKVPSQASVAGWWVDLSMASGNPPPNYYASNPTEAATLNGWRGIFHGDNVSPATRVLTHLGLTTPTAGLVGQYKLLDYLLYYPFVDLDDLTYQSMDNSVVPSLPRYADGSEVLPMLVCQAPTTGGGSFTFDYINDHGLTRTSPTNYYSVSSANIASIVTPEPAQTNTGPGPFLRLAEGCRGVRQILGVQNLVSNGGLASIVLVKPLADTAIREINTTSELSFLDQRNRPPVILDGAYLHFIMNCAATVAAGQLHGYAKFGFH
jgi:hypothetical protein